MRTWRKIIFSKHVRREDLGFLAGGEALGVRRCGEGLWPPQPVPCAHEGQSDPALRVLRGMHSLLHRLAPAPWGEPTLGGALGFAEETP